MSDFSLPNEWLESKLSDVCEYIRGITYNKSQSDSIEKDGYLPILRANNIQNGQIIFDDLVFVDASLIKENQLLRKSDILIAMSSGSKALVGKSASVKSDLDFAFGAFCGVLRPFKSVEARLINYFTQSAYYRNSISKLSAGANINNLKPSHFDELVLPLPPKAEQEKIAELLDSHLAQVETIKTRLNAIIPILKKFRQSVLANAVSGELTKDWRQNNDVKEWQQVEWFDITTKEKDAFKRGPFGSSLKKDMFVESGYKVYEQYCPINDDCSFARYYITPEKFEEMKEFEVKADDFLISCSGVSLGRITQVPKNYEQGIINQALLRVRLNNDIYNGKFFKILFRSPTFQKVIFDNSTGSAIPNLKASKLLKKISVPLLDIEEQIEIVKRVEELFAFADTIETQINNALDRVSHLTQSILYQAFTGKLTADWRTENIDLITGDNSAESLLAKIQAEKDKAKSVKKPRKKKEA